MWSWTLSQTSVAWPTLVLLTFRWICLAVRSTIMFLLSRELYPFRSLKRWFALFEVQQVWEQFYLWPTLLDKKFYCSVIQGGRLRAQETLVDLSWSGGPGGNYSHHWVKRTIRCLPAMLSSTTSVHLVTSLSPTTKQILIISSSFGSIPINQIINLNHTVILNLSQLTIRFVLVGATSFSLVDCESPFPNVFSRWFSQHQHYHTNPIHFRSQ